MSLKSFTASIGAITDASNNGKNYVSGQAIYIRTINGTLASIFSDSAGLSEITQDGVSNVTDNRGQFTFYVEAGDYVLEYKNQSSPITVVGSEYFKNMFKVSQYEVKPEDIQGNVITLPFVLESVQATIDGRVIKPSSYVVDTELSTITMTGYNLSGNEDILITYPLLDQTTIQPTEYKGYVTLEEFGGLGGANDDTGAFDQALAASNLNDLPIKLLKNKYTFNIDVPTHSSLDMYSENSRATIFTKRRTALFDLERVALSNIRINFTLNESGRNGLDIYRPNEVDIERCRFIRAPRNNVALYECSNFIIKDSRFDDAGTEQYVNPASGVNIGGGLVLQDCVNNGQDPTYIKDCVALRPWQIGFFVVNSAVGTESAGNVIDGSYVIGARDNGIRTQTQGLPFDPFRCRNHVVKNNYVAGSSIDNYRCNGANNTFVNNISYDANSYGVKSDGGSNNIMSHNHDNGSAVGHGLRLGADTINYDMSHNTSINASGGAAAIYGVIAEDGITIKNINCSNNTVLNTASSASSYGFVAVPSVSSRIKNLSFTGNYAASSDKQSADFKQVDDSIIACNAFLDSNVASGISVSEIADCDGLFITSNKFTSTRANSALNIRDLSSNIKSVSNDYRGFVYAPAVVSDGAGTGNLFTAGFSDYNSEPASYSLANASGLGSRLTRSVDYDYILNSPTGQEAAVRVLGWVTQFIADNESGLLNRYYEYS
jgi:hypothetical protein